MYKLCDDAILPKYGEKKMLSRLVVTEYMFA